MCPTVVTSWCLVCIEHASEWRIEWQIWGGEFWEDIGLKIGYSGSSNITWTFWIFQAEGIWGDRPGGLPLKQVISSPCVRCYPVSLSPLRILVIKDSHSLMNQNEQTLESLTWPMALRSLLFIPVMFSVTFCFSSNLERRYPIRVISWDVSV